MAAAAGAAIAHNDLTALLYLQGYRNEEIIRRNERERETNILIRGLQNLVLQLQPGRARVADVLDDDPTMQGREGVDNSTRMNGAGGV